MKIGSGSVLSCVVYGRQCAEQREPRPRPRPRKRPVIFLLTHQTRNCSNSVGSAGTGRGDVPRHRRGGGGRAHGEPDGPLRADDQLTVAAHVALRHQPLRAAAGAAENAENFPDAPGRGCGDVLFCAFSELPVRSRRYSQGMCVRVGSFSRISSWSGLPLYCSCCPQQSKGASATTLLRSSRAVVDIRTWQSGDELAFDL